jgi:hypothetical protein
LKKLCIVLFVVLLSLAVAGCDWNGNDDDNNNNNGMGGNNNGGTGNGTSLIIE